MNRLTATKTAPVTQKVRFDGVVHHLPVGGDGREPPRAQEVEQHGADHQQDQCQRECHLSHSCVQTRGHRRHRQLRVADVSEVRTRAERIDEMPVDRDQLASGCCSRIIFDTAASCSLRARSGSGTCRLRGRRGTSRASCSRADADQPAFPGAEQRGHADEDDVDEVGMCESPKGSKYISSPTPIRPTRKPSAAPMKPSRTTSSVSR